MCVFCLFLCYIVWCGCLCRSSLPIGRFYMHCPPLSALMSSLEMMTQPWSWSHFHLCPVPRVLCPWRIQEPTSLVSVHSCIYCEGDSWIMKVFVPVKFTQLVSLYEWKCSNSSRFWKGCTIFNCWSEGVNCNWWLYAGKRHPTEKDNKDGTMNNKDGRNQVFTLKVTKKKIH